jgi:phage baseplate assembly protein W
MVTIIHSIKYPFAIDRGLGKLREENGYNDHVVQMMKQVLFTNPGERIDRPDFGCGLQRMVFEPNSEISAGMLNITIVQSLERWLGDVISVIDVKVKAIEEKLEVGIVYLVKARQERRFLNLEVTL